MGYPFIQSRKSSRYVVPKICPLYRYVVFTGENYFSLSEFHLKRMLIYRLKKSISELLIHFHGGANNGVDLLVSLL